MSIFATPTAQEQKPKKKSLGNITEDQLNSNQQGVPITYLAGRQYVAGQFMSPAYNVIHKPITTQTGKDSSSTTGYTDFADFALALCLGGRQPLEKIFKVVVNAEIVWQNDSGLAFGAAEYVDITLPHFGQIRVYKGSFTQPVDTLVLGTRGTLTTEDPRDLSTWPFNTGGNPDHNGMQAGDSDPLSGHYDRHPKYIGVAYLVAKKFKLGRNPSPIPTIILEVQRSLPWFSTTTVDRDAMALNANASGVNPVGVIFDLITDPIFGMKQDESILLKSGWESALSKASWARISPKITDLKSAKEVLSDLLRYFDGRFRTVGELLDLVVFDHGAIDLNTVPILTDDDLDGEPAMKPLDWSHINPLTIVTYSDKDHHYNDRQQKFPNVNARRIVGNLPPVNEDRPFFTDAALAKRWVTEFGYMNSQPIQAGQLPIKREWLDDNATAPDAQTRQIKCADRLLFNSASRGISLLLQINEIELPEDKSGRANLEIENERGYWPALFIPTPQNLLGNFVIEPVEITTARIVDLPAALRDRSAMEVAVLALRPRKETIGFNVFVSSDNSVFDDSGAGNQKFAMFGQLGVNYSGVTADLDVTTGIEIDLFGWDLDRVVSQTDTQRDDNHLLLWVDDEIMSVGQVTPLGSGRFKMFLRRAQYGTVKAAHVAGANCWLMFREELTPIANANFQPSTTFYFKFQPFTALQSLDLADITSVSHALPAAPAFSSVSSLSLSNAVGISEGKTPDVRIIAIWEAAADEGIIDFEVQFQKDGDTTWKSVTTASKVIDFEVDPATLYNVRVRAINNFGAPGDWFPFPDPMQIVSGTLDQFSIHHLELDGQADDTEFTGRIAKLRCGITSIDSFEEIGLESNGIQAGEEDPLFKDYFWEFFDPTFSQLLYDRPTQDPKLDLDVIEALGLQRSIGVQVSKRSTVQNLISRPARIVISNPAPSLLTGIVATPGFDHVDFTHDPVGDLDLAGVLGWRSTDPAFAIGDAGVELIYNGPAGAFTIPQPEATTYYYRFAAFDRFCSTPPSSGDIALLHISNPIEAMTKTAMPTLPAPAVDPGSGSFSASFNATLSIDAAQTARFTEDGSDVTDSSPEWPGSIGAYTTKLIDRSMMLHVRGFLADGTPTKQAEYIYTFVAGGSTGVGTVGSVSLQKVSGHLGKTAIIVSLTCPTTGATIKFKINGGTTTTYSGNVTLQVDDEIEFWAEKSGLNPSAHSYFTNQVSDPGGGGNF